MSAEKNFLIASAIVLVAGLSLLVLIIVLVFAFFVSPKINVSQEPVADSGASSPSQTNVQSAPGSNAPAPASLWALIEKNLVESACLKESKKSAGGLAWTVNSCSCTETISDSEKHYSCSVSALDGEHPLGIACFRETELCRISSEKGIANFSFEELSQLVN